jgi:RNA polymerase sigma factor (sigma-70 family)
MTSPRTNQRHRVDVERNRAIVDRLAQERHRQLLAIARRGGVDADIAEDVVQTALLDVLRAFPGPDDPRQAYLYAARCVQNEASHARRRFARKESRNVAMPESVLKDRANGKRDVALIDADASDPLELAIAREAVVERRQRLLELPADQRAVLALGAAGFGTAEIARMLGLSERGVRKRVERANRALRNFDRES